jgi:class 3 adenylate cyclase
VSGARFEHAVAAFLRQEFGASVAAIIGFVDILLEDARKQGLEDFVPDLDRMRLAGAQLAAFIEQAVNPRIQPGKGAVDRARLRHDLRTPLNAIKGYGELLVEEARGDGREALFDDLTKVLDLADRLLGEIDKIVEFAGDGLETVGNVLQTIRPLGGADITDRHAIASPILVVDDNASNRELLSRRLRREGHSVMVVESGASALELVATESFDLVLLDLMMPGLSGFEVLCRLKADECTRHIPVIMISALDEFDSAVRCIEAGAEDYLPKPFNPILLRARIGACLEKKQLRDREQAVLEQLRVEKERSEALLLNILPRTIVERMRQGETVIADRIAEATILFSDLVDFTSIAAKRSPEQTIKLLGLLFSRFDLLAARHRIEKIKTTGDGYLVAGGLLDTRADHAVAVAEMALAMLEAVESVSQALDEPLRLRIGLHTGPLIAGVIETHKFAYDIWGDTVNTAKRMETYGLPGHVHVSATTRRALGDAFRFEPRGVLDIKGKGSMETYFLYHDI